MDFKKAFETVGMPYAEGKQVFYFKPKGCSFMVVTQDIDEAVKELDEQVWKDEPNSASD